MGFQIGRIDHHELLLGRLRDETSHDPGEDTRVAPALPSVVEGLGRPIDGRRIAPAQPIAVDENELPPENRTVTEATI